MSIRSLAAHLNPDRCMKCGFCLSPCPVYALDHRENHAPRGRNILIQRVGRELLAAGEVSYQDSLNYCLVCGRCNAVCPARLTSGEITQAARARMFAEEERFQARQAENRQLLKNRTSILATRHHLVQADTKPAENEAVGLEPPAGAPAKGRVAVFPGCVFTSALPAVGRSILASIAQLGYQVVCPANCTCCGQELWLMGDMATSRAMARQNIEAFSGQDKIVAGCSACSTAMKNYRYWFDDDPEMKAAAEAFSSRVVDYIEFLAQQDMVWPGRKNGSIGVTYHDPCYLKYQQNIAAEPRALLRSLPGIEFIEMDQADACCGENLLDSARAGVGAEMRRRKIESIENSGAEVVTTSCSGCILNISEGLRNAESPVEVLHISQLLMESFPIGGDR